MATSSQCSDFVRCLSEVIHKYYFITEQMESYKVYITIFKTITLSISRSDDTAELFSRRHNKTY